MQKKQKQQHDDDEHDHVMIDFSKRGIYTPRDLLLDVVFRVYGEKLYSLGVPIHYQEEILSPAMTKFIEHMENDSRNADLGRLGMVLAIDILTTREQNEKKATRNTRRNSSSLPDWRNHLPASRPNLNLFRISQAYLDKKKDDDVCAICLEKPALGDEFARLRCSHTYHCVCIVQSTYKSSNLCPLCRCQITG